MKPTQTVFIQIIERPARKVIVCRGKQAEDYFESPAKLPISHRLCSYQHRLIDWLKEVL